MRWASCAAVLAALSGVAFLFLPFLSSQAQNKQDLEQLEKQIEVNRRQRDVLHRERRDLDQGVSSLRRNLIRAARMAQEQESVLNRLEVKLPELQKIASARNAELYTRRRQMTGMLVAIERLSRNPPQALILLDAEPLKIVRSAMLLRLALPHLRAQASALRNDLIEISTVRRELLSRRTEIQAAMRGLEMKRARLNALMLHKVAARRRRIKETRRVDARLSDLAKQASSLRELFANLQAESERAVSRPQGRVPPASAALVKPLIGPALGRMTRPARGSVIERFGQDTGSGGKAKGATFKTRPRAQVGASFDGTVVFSGTFKGYGQILIIEHGDAYHTLLAGMRRVDAGLGQRLLAGEPVGIMGSQEAGTRLYVEVRRRGQPVNPLPWFSAAIDKVRG